MSLLILGKNGQVGRALCAAQPDAIGLSRAECDLAATDKLANTIASYAPSAIINAAAYTAVDIAESEPELAHRVNAIAPGIISDYCAQSGIPLIHYSTDYVFDGSGGTARRESDPTGPLNVYGESKLAGEAAITASGADAIILRTSWVYDAVGKNFYTTMRRLMQERESLNIVADQIGAPSYAGHLADYTVQLLSKARQMQDFPSGIYHFCNGGEASWYGFAEAVHQQLQQRDLQLATQSLVPIPSNAYPTPAKRPLNSRLSMAKLQDVFGITMPDWQAGLQDCLQEDDKLAASA